MNWRSLSGAIALSAILTSGTTGYIVAGYLANQGLHGDIAHNYPVAYTDAAFKVASTAASKVVYTLPSALFKLTKVCIRPTTAFAGTSITAVTCSLGTSTAGKETIYAPALSVMQTTGTKCFGGMFSGLDLATPDTDLDVTLNCTATGANFGDGGATVLTQGAVTVTIYTTTMPAASVTGTPGVDGG